MAHPRNALLLLLSLALSVAMGEAALRALDIRPVVGSPPRYLMRADAELGFSLSPGQSWRHASREYDYRLETNRFGFRGAAWDPGTPLLIVAGSSFAFGYGVAERDLFTSRLAEWFGPTRPALQVANMAVFGYNLHQIERVLRRAAETFDVRGVVLVYSYQNGFYADALSQYEVIEGYLVKAGRFPEGRVSLLYRTYAALYRNVRLVAVTIDQARRSWASWRRKEERDTKGGLSANAIAELDRAARHMGRIRRLLPEVPFAVMPGTNRRLAEGKADSRAVHEAVKARLLGEGLTVIDIYPRIARIGRDAHFAVDGHWTARGHEAVAEAVRDWVERALPPVGIPR